MKEWISDKRRESYLKCCYARIYRGQSVLIQGTFGSGKTQFLRRINCKKRKLIFIESLSNIHQILSVVMGECGYYSDLNYSKSHEYLKVICSMSEKIVLICDEVQDIDKRIWSYFKRIMDNGVSFLFAGLPRTVNFLNDKHPDIISRLKILTLFPVELEDILLSFDDKIEQAAIEQLYAASNGDMRKFKEYIYDLRDYVGNDVITIDVVIRFLSEIM